MDENMRYYNSDLLSVKNLFIFQLLDHLKIVLTGEMKKKS